MSQVNSVPLIETTPPNFPAYTYNLNYFLFLSAITPSLNDCAFLLNGKGNMLCAFDPQGHLSIIF